MTDAFGRPRASSAIRVRTRRNIMPKRGRSPTSARRARALARVRTKERVEGSREASNSVLAPIANDADGRSRGARERDVASPADHRVAGLGRDGDVERNDDQEPRRDRVAVIGTGLGQLRRVSRGPITRTASIMNKLLQRTGVPALITTKRQSRGLGRTPVWCVFLSERHQGHLNKIGRADAMRSPHSPAEPSRFLHRLLPQTMQGKRKNPKTEQNSRDRAVGARIVRHG